MARRAGSVHKGTEKNQANRSTTGPKIRQCRKVKQKLKRYISYRSVPCEQKWYDIVLFRSDVEKNRSTFLTCLTSTDDPKLAVAIRPNCTSLILLIVSGPFKQKTSTAYLYSFLWILFAKFPKFLKSIIMQL